MSSPKEFQKQSHSCSCQGCKATNHTETLLNLAKHWNSPQPSATFRKLPPEPTPAHTGTLRNLPEPSGTFRNTHRNSPEPSGTLRNLPEVAPGTHTSTHRKPTPAHTGNLHQHTPELSGTFRNLPPEPAPQTQTGIHRSLSGLKTPLAYAVGEHVLSNQTKDEQMYWPWLINFWWASEQKTFSIRTWSWRCFKAQFYASLAIA